MANLSALRRELGGLADTDKAVFLQRFFRTGKGEYAEGDVFRGITVPETRRIAKKFRGISLMDVGKMLESKIHEERLCGFLILVDRFRAGSDGEKGAIFDFYISHARRANNWDLVDLSADKICGEYLAERSGGDRELLYRFAASDNLWERRIAIVSTFAFIRRKQFGDTFSIAEKLLHDRHDLIHKACGWMLREAGKRDEKALEGFLRKHAAEMPRTMLRYAVERLPERKKKLYMGMKARKQKTMQV